MIKPNDIKPKRIKSKVKRITIAHDIDDSVWVEELEVWAKVKSIWITAKGIQYECRYFYSGKAENPYLYKDEISRTKT